MTGSKREDSFHLETRLTKRSPPEKGEGVTLLHITEKRIDPCHKAVASARSGLNKQLPGPPNRATRSWRGLAFDGNTHKGLADAVWHEDVASTHGADTYVNSHEGLARRRRAVDALKGITPFGFGVPSV